MACPALSEHRRAARAWSQPPQGSPAFPGPLGGLKGGGGGLGLVCHLLPSQLMGSLSAFPLAWRFPRTSSLGWAVTCGVLRYGGKRDKRARLSLKSRIGSR